MASSLEIVTFTERPSNDNWFISQIYRWVLTDIPEKNFPVGLYIVECFRHKPHSQSLFINS